MAMTAAEQYMLELVNRTRLDPVGEAARMGVSLNDGLAAGTLDGHARQVLAPNALLELAASRHSQWQLANDVFSHTGVGGSSPTTRVKATGYVTTGAGENLAWQGTTGAMDLNAIISVQHKDLFLSPDHRRNMLTDSYREAGIGQEAGKFFTQGHDFNSSMVTQNFSKSGTNYFVTGVSYTDRNANNFYDIGEGVGGTSFSAGGRSSTTASAGGYALRVTLDDAVSVTGTVGSRNFSVLLDVSTENAKLDIVNGNTFYTSTDIDLVSGIHSARLLGVGYIDATGTNLANRLIGNKGKNALIGEGGNDTLDGGAGMDRIYGGDGADSLIGGSSHDWLRGGNDNDTLSGGTGMDTLNGDAGRDVLTGGADADRFVFSSGGSADRITDFTHADQLMIDNAIWGGSSKTAAQVVSQYGEMVSGHAVLDFNNGQTIAIYGITSLSALAGEITII